MGMGALGKGPYWSRFGWDYSVILRARNFSPRPESRFPRLPGAILVALLLSAVPLFNGDCPGFLEKHLLFSLAWLACGISTTSWLLVALSFRRGTDADRTARIEEFMSDSAAPVPAPVAGLERPPISLGLWNCFNIALFAVLIIVVALTVSGRPILRGG